MLPIKQIYLPIENHPRRGVLWTPAGERSSPLRQKDREFHVLCPFSHVLQARYSVLHLIGVLSGDKIAFSCGRRGTAIAVDEELIWTYDTSSVSLRLPPSPTGEGLFSASWKSDNFPDKHCFFGHKSEAPREAGQKIIPKLATCFLLFSIYHLYEGT